MGRLGDAIEGFFGQDDRFQTVRATVQSTVYSGPLEKARRWTKSPYGRLTEQARNRPLSDKIRSKSRSIWLSRPASLRIEERFEARGKLLTSTTVIDNNRGWERDPDGCVTFTEDTPSKSLAEDTTLNIAADRHFNPAQIRDFLIYLALEPLGPVRTAGRDCERLRAVPRAHARIWPHWLPVEGDEHEFHVDPERAAILNIISRFEGEIIQSDEVLEIAYDEPMAPELFIYEPAPDDREEDPIPVVERLSLADAISRVSFTLLVPTRVPGMDQVQFEVNFFPPHREAIRSHIRLNHFPFLKGGLLWVNESDHLDPFFHSFEWEQIELEGGAQSNVRISDPGEPEGNKLLAFEQQGTHVVIGSTFDRAELIDLALSFVPANFTLMS